MQQSGEKSAAGCPAGGSWAAAAAAACLRCPRPLRIRSYGTRLRPLTLTVPKPIIDFGEVAGLEFL